MPGRIRRCRRRGAARHRGRRRDRARANIVVYFAPTPIAASSTRINDRRARHSEYRRRSSPSAGAARRRVDRARRVDAFDGALADAAALGVTVSAAAGDHGAADGGGDGTATPTSRPRARTSLPAAARRIVVGSGKIASEVVWNDNAAGPPEAASARPFEVPAYQHGISLTAPTSANPPGNRHGRGVPTSPATPTRPPATSCASTGRWTMIGGTSAVAPLYAGLIAQLNQTLGRPVGALLPVLYGIPAADRANVLRDITTGNNSVPASQFGPATAGYPPLRDGTRAPAWAASTVRHWPRSCRARCGTTRRPPDDRALDLSAPTVWRSSPLQQAALVGRLAHPGRVALMTALRGIAREVVVTVDAVALGPVTQAPADRAGAGSPTAEEPRTPTPRTTAPATITATTRITISTADIRTSARTLRIAPAQQARLLAFQVGRTARVWDWERFDSTPNRRPLRVASDAPEAVLRRLPASTQGPRALEVAGPAAAVPADATHNTSTPS